MTFTFGKHMHHINAPAAKKMCGESAACNSPEGLGESLGLPRAERPPFLTVLLHSDLETALSLELGGTVEKLRVPEASGLPTLSVAQPLFSSEILNNILCVGYFIGKLGLARLLPALWLSPIIIWEDSVAEDIVCWL